MSPLECEKRYVIELYKGLEYDRRKFTTIFFLVLRNFNRSITAWVDPDETCIFHVVVNSMKNHINNNLMCGAS